MQKHWPALSMMSTKRKKRMKNIENFDELVKYLKSNNPKLITIDGIDGSGKTYLAKQLHKTLGGTHLTEETYRSSNLDGNFVPKFDELILDIARSLPKGLVIYDSVLMLWIADQCGIKPDLTIYIKKMSQMELWNDEVELDDGMTKEEAIVKATAMGGTNFRKQIISYHFDYLPHKTADVIYERLE